MGEAPLRLPRGLAVLHGEPLMRPLGEDGEWPGALMQSRLKFVFEFEFS